MYFTNHVPSETMYHPADSDPDPQQLLDGPGCQVSKRCSGCKQSLPVARFGLVERNKSKLNTRCKTCINNEGKRLRMLARSAQSNSTGTGARAVVAAAAAAEFEISDVVPDIFTLSKD